MPRLEVTEALASFIATHRYKDLPPDVVNEAKRAIADCIGGGIAGLSTQVGTIARGLVATEAGPSAVWGTDIRTTPRNAALANGALAHAHDLDDTNDSMRGHPSAPVVPAIFALGDAIGADGPALMTAYVVGVEVEAKLGRAVNLEHYQRGWHTTSTLGSIGAAAACARLLGLNETECRHALAIAASMACGLRANFGTMTKPLHAGLAAQNGVLAAQLAAAGLDANPNAIEAFEGFFDLFCGVDNVNAERAMTALGAPYDVMSPGIIYKKYPTCSLTHLALDILVTAAKAGEIDPSDIESVRCGTGFRWETTLPYHDAKTGLEGKFSMEYCVAAALVYGDAWFDQFEDRVAQEPAMREMMRRVTVYTHPDLKTRDSVDRDFTEIEIKHGSGRKFLRRLNVPKGNPANPLSWDELETKFMRCAVPAIGQGAAAAMWQRLRTLDEQRNLDLRIAA